MLVDCHVHLNHYHEDEPAASPAQMRDQLLAELGRHGVDHAVALTSYKVNGSRPGVEDVLAAVDEDPRVTVVEGLRWRDEPATDLYRLERRVASGRVKGIKLYPGYEPYAINDPSLEAVFRIAAKHDVPVMVHTGDTHHPDAKVRYAHPLLLDDVAVDWRDVDFVMCHLGNPWLHDAAEVLYKNDNVFADVSGLTLGSFSHAFERRQREAVEDMILYMGDPERQLLYGSDWPLVDMGEYLAFFDHLDLDEEAREAVRWRTAAELFGIDMLASRRAWDAAEPPRQSS